MNYRESVINSQKELNVISTNDKFLTTKAKFGPSKITKIPLSIDERLSFLAAVIIGDGHLKKDKAQITIELTDYRLLGSIKSICSELFERDFTVTLRKFRSGQKPSKTLYLDSKAIHNFFKDVFEIPPGKKSDIVRVPKFIKKSSDSIKVAFLSGIMSTEGGKRKRGYGLSTASNLFWRDLIDLFKDVGIIVLKDKWIYKKYNREYYGISFKEKNMLDLPNLCADKKISEILTETKIR